MLSLATASLSLLLAAEPVPPAVAALVGKNCLGCHQGPKALAGLDLAKLDFNLDQAETHSRWVQVYDAVEKGAMPPGNTPVDRKAFAAALAKPLIEHAALRNASNGRAVLRRLNRYEYENTMRDLLSAPWLQLRDSLPEDGIVSRFN